MYIASHVLMIAKANELGAIRTPLLKRVAPVSKSAIYAISRTRRVLWIKIHFIEMVHDDVGRIQLSQIRIQ